jgi:hypothetical protein
VGRGICTQKEEGRGNIVTLCSRVATESDCQFTFECSGNGAGKRVGGNRYFFTTRLLWRERASGESRHNNTTHEQYDVMTELKESAYNSTKGRDAGSLRVEQ